TGVLRWTPSFLQQGSYPDIVLSVSDGNRASSEAIAVTVENVNRAPVIAPLPAQSGREGVQVQFTLAAGDVDGDPLVFRAANLPTGARLDSASGQVTWTPDFSQAGQYALRFFAEDGHGGRDQTEVV